MPNVAARSRRAEGRVTRRYARLMRRKDSMTYEHLVGELMMSQIDATLSVSHAIQEAGQQFERLSTLLEEMKWRMEPPAYGSKAKLEAHIGAMEQDIRWLQEQTEGLLKLVREDIDNIVRPQPPWWKEAEWFGWLLLLIFVIVVWFIIMYNFDSFVRLLGGG